MVLRTRLRERGVVASGARGEQRLVNGDRDGDRGCEASRDFPEETGEERHGVTTIAALLDAPHVPGRPGWLGRRSLVIGVCWRVRQVNEAGADDVVGVNPDPLDCLDP
jgi:hypothetical protein